MNNKELIELNDFLMNVVSEYMNQLTDIRVLDFASYNTDFFIAQQEELIKNAS